ncbi:MAG: OmpA family protein [Saprospiraceae bacterium]|nr:OmpA family protein [Saprospiraceae bacterium]MBP7699368.1 OmpA family protein [Saprospiraceae bacterium]
MTALIIILCLVMLAIALVQIGRVTELTTRIRGEEEVQYQNNNFHAIVFVVFIVTFLVWVVWSAWDMSNYMLGYGPHKAASAHGGSLDKIFNITLFFTGIVFVLCHIFLAYYLYKYRGRKGVKSYFIPHDNRLEIIWTAIPAVVMTYLVIGGLDAWNDVMADVKDGESYTEIEAVGMQFAWLIRYPGADGKLGTRNFRKISSTNPLGQDWTDTKNADDFHPDEIWFPVNKKVRVRLGARDVLHNFYLPHFRLKMDCVPGMPTYFVFTPTKTTEEYRQELSKYPEYQVPADPNDPEGKKKWEAFEYELACAELCGNGHFSMRRIVKVVSQDEYDAWLKKQNSFYQANIRNTDEDPYKGKLLGAEIGTRKAEFKAAMLNASKDTAATARVLTLKNLFFETGSAVLAKDSEYELQNIVDAFQQYPNLSIELSGHTDNVGNPAANLTLSQQRAASVKTYLVGKGVPAAKLRTVGYGDTKPVGDNNTDAGKASNRRTELKILSI